MSSKLCIGLFLCASFCALSGTRGWAQTSGFPNGLGRIGPSGAEVAGAIIGAVAVIGIVVYLVIPKQTTIEGCVESREGGLQLTDEKHHRNQSFVLPAGSITLHAGQRVVLKGKKGKKVAAGQEFEVRKLVNDEGSCAKNAELLIPNALIGVPSTR